MKTSILFGINYRERGFLPAEAAAYQAATGRGQYNVPKYHPAHNEKTQSGGRLNLATGKLELKLGKERVIEVPAQISIGSFRFNLDFIKGRLQACKPWRREGKVTGAVVITEADAAHIDALDQQIAALSATRAQVMKEAVKRGKPLARADCEA